MKIIAHRGDSARFPENTLAAFRSALEAGADMIELDVRLSRDRRLAVIHDASVERTTAGQGRVADLSLAELQALGIPALEEVLALPIAINVEIKAPEAVAGLVELVRDRDVVVSSFDLDALDRVRELNPAQAVAYLSNEDDWSRVLERAVAAGAFALNPPRKALTPALVARAHAAGLKVMSYTVNDPAEACRLREWLVDAIFTDEPARMVAILGPCAEVAE